jgi:hypothetical protein
MPIASIRRRVGRLEGSGLFVSLADYPPLSSAEVEAIGYRVRDGEPLTREELDRLHRQRSAVGGEFVISANRGSVTVKHYGGVDLAEL